MQASLIPIRSILAGFFGLAATLFNSIFVLLTIPLGDKAQYFFAKTWSHMCHYSLRGFAGLGYEVQGEENLPKEASVVMIKHQSIWEIVLLIRFIPQLVFIFKREIMSIPILSHAMISLKMIDIDRSGGRSAVKDVIEKGTDRLRQGLWIAIFPEGTRMPFGYTRRFGKSGVILAKEAQAPLILIAHNGGEFWPSKTYKISPGTVNVIISEPIPTLGREVDEIVIECEEWLEKTMCKISPKYAKIAKNLSGQS